MPADSSRPNSCLFASPLTSFGSSMAELDLGWTSPWCWNNTFIMPLKQSSISGFPNYLHHKVRTLSVTIRPSALYRILFSLFPSIDQLVSDSLLNVSSPPPPHDSHSRLSQIPGASTPHPFFILYISHDAFLFLEPERLFPSSELLQCPVQMRRCEEKLVGYRFLEQWRLEESVCLCVEGVGGS